jgi:hypothetical protein
MKYTIAVGTDLGTVQNKTLPWHTIADRLSKHEVAVAKGGRYLVGGEFDGTQRKEANLLNRSLITLDLDNVPEGMNIADIEFMLIMQLDCAFAAYSTFSHTPAHPKIRIVVPLSRTVTPSEYREVSKDFAALLPELTFDPCSFVPNQAVYLPACPDLSIAWSVAQGEAPHVVPDVIHTAARNEPDDLERAVLEQPLDISDDEVDAYLAGYPAAGLEYDQWIKVGAALHHQFRGDVATGFSRWFDWSAKSDKHDPSMMQIKWRSFGNSTRVVTFASVIHLARASGVEVERSVAVAVENSAFERLLEATSKVSDMAAYDDLKARIQNISVTVLPLDKRSLLAQEVYDAWGKDRGLTKSDIKAQLKPSSKGKLNEVERPDWLEPWVYIESTCEYYERELHYAIKREAFNQKYARTMTVNFGDDAMLASVYAANHCDIETVVDLLFWPGAGQFVQHEGKRYLNTYRETGIAPCGVLDDEGQAVVDMFMGHVRFMIENEDEQRLLIDYLAWIIQNPGSKINWALLLQGAQGVGKSYFAVVMQNLLGEMCRNVEPMALSGRFTSWAYGAVLAVIEEIRISGDNRFELIDRLKPFVSNNVIQIEAKGQDHRTVPNFQSYLLLTNHKDALPVNENDRRYAPIFSRVQSEQQLFEELGGRQGADTYFTRLFDDSERRADALSYFLRNWNISEGFSAKGRAPQTSAREEMIALAVSPDRSLLEDAIDIHQCDIINDNVLDVTWLNKLCEGEGTYLPKTRAMSAILLEMGYKQVTGRRIKISKTNGLHYVWFKGDEKNVKNVVRDFHGGADDCPF